MKRRLDPVREEQNPARKPAQIAACYWVGLFGQFSKILASLQFGQFLCGSIGRTQQDLARVHLFGSLRCLGNDLIRIQAALTERANCWRNSSSL